MRAACEFRFQRVEALAPLPSQVSDPALDSVESVGPERVQPARALGAHVGEAALSEHAQLPRDGGLREPELCLDDVDDLAGTAFTGREQLEDSPSDGVAEDVEGLHRRKLYHSRHI